ncbi:pyridoxamine 5'-phosphate oxidase family protein [Candidatus Fermentibacteria bacterium]|nr:pyridoxamine 5'-phosphate oxidase family protein [Candidatus Fermentibacteria bacterium]
MNESRAGDASLTDPRITRLLRSQRLAVLATDEEGSPYLSLVAYAAAPDLTRVYFATLSSTRKARALEANPRVALLVDDRRNDGGDLADASALTLTGLAEAVPARRRDEAARLLAEAHPELSDFLSMADCQLYAVRITGCVVVSRFTEDPAGGSWSGRGQTSDSHS